MKVAIAWNGLPFYGARLMRPIISELGSSVEILATKGPQSQKDIEEALGATICMIEAQSRTNWKQLEMQVPDLFFHTGWAYPSFHALAREVKNHGGTVVCMVDNSRKYNLRQVIGKQIFRWVYRPHIDAVMVPGESGKELMEYFGMPAKLIYEGMYGADPKIFRPGPPLEGRRYDFLFVGQFIERKGIKGLIHAVREMRMEKKEFMIAAIGDGPKRTEMESSNIEIHPFAGADDVAQMMRSARFLVLPSIEDHWGVVVHEAVLSGCGLILSSGVGSRLDLLTPRNGFVCEPGRPMQMMQQALDANDDWLDGCRQESLRLANGFGPEQWCQAFRKICDSVHGR
jgi:glycosyltransferase involved in cell wall biosynthesis